MLVTSRTLYGCAASEGQSWTYRSNLLKKGDPDSKLVDAHFVANHHGIYRHFEDGIYWKPSFDGSWHVHVSNHRRQRKSHVEIRYIFVQMDDPALAVMALVNKIFKATQYRFGAVIYPQAHTAMFSLNELKRCGVIDSVDVSGIRYDPSYPVGPAPQTVQAQLYEGLSVSLPPLDETVIDDAIFERFKNNISHAIATSGAPTINKRGTRKIGAASYHDILRTLEYRAASRYDRSSLALSIYSSESTLAVGILPKLGATTSTGKIRRIYPMSIGLELAQRRLFGDCKSVVFDGVSRVCGAKFPSLRYTYDVSSCDRVLYHYVRKLVGSNESLKAILLPAIYTRDGVRYTDQYPSGVYATSIVTECFSAAILQSLGVPGYIQGDGIMTDVPLEHKLLRREPDYTINGFDYSGAFPRYSNGAKRLTSPRITTGRLSDWELRRQIYITLLNADPATLPESRKDNPYSSYNRSQLIELSNRYGVCRRLLRYTGVNAVEDAPGGWDVVPTQTSLCRHYTVSGVPSELVSLCRSALL